MENLTTLCGVHNMKWSFNMLNERIPSNNPAKLASILGKEKKWDRAVRNADFGKSRRSQDYY